MDFLNDDDMNKKVFYFLGVLLISYCAIGLSQTDYEETAGEELNNISTAVPFLTIAPDSRASGMGDVGVATTPDINSMHWNPAKFAFIDGELGASLSYVPWLKKLVNDINLYNLTGYKRFGKYQTLSFSFLYFSLGDITFTNSEGRTIRTVEPNEFAIDVAYSRLFSRTVSGAVAFRYIRSDLSKGVVNDIEISPGNAFAVDVASYFKKDIRMGDYDGLMSYGINISNIGSKIRYSENDEMFIPINLRLGAALTLDIDDYNSITFALDLNKLLVPTTPIYSDSTDEEGKQIILYGKGDPDAPVPVAMFRSFYDAPGVNLDGTGVFKEELREIMCGVGLEYWYAEQFAIRGGYFYEHRTKGNRKFFTLGLGLKLNVFGLDISYIIPQHPNNPLANTIRFTLLFNFEPSK